MLRQPPWRLVLRVGLVSGIVAAGTTVAMSKPKEKTVCGTVVTLDCDRDVRTPSLRLRVKHKEEFVFVDLSWVDAISAADRYYEADICGTGVEEKRKGDKHLHVEDVAHLKVVSPAPILRRRFGEGAHRICEADVTMATATRQVRPNYTRAAMDAQIQGTVLLEAVVQTDGHVGETRVLRSLDTKYGLDLEAIRACQAWTFEPAQLHGSPVPLIVTMEMSFTLK